MIAEQLELLDCSVFFDEFFETNYLGKAWHSKFKEVFSDRARLVVCLLDKHHLDKIWPTFERECFAPRVEEEAVIPIHLDDTIFPGIPTDIVGIHFDPGGDPDGLANRVTDEIVFKLHSRLEDA